MPGTSPLAHRLSATALATFAALALAATTAIAPATADAAGLNAYNTAKLVSDQAGQAAHVDTRLKNAWGIAFNPGGFSWVANNGTGTSTLYDGNGVPQSLVVAIPAATGTGPGNPTGIVYNGSADFMVTKGSRHGAGIFIFANEDGAISAWAPAVDGTNAILAVVPGADAPIYKGLAISGSVGGNRLYATDFAHARVDVFDKNFAPVNTGGGFVDPTMPAGYAPFGIQAVQGKLVVTYAKQVAGSGDEKDGPGLGFVDLFDTDGHLIHRVASHKGLNAPWGIAIAPSNFGAFSSQLLIANFGDGTVSGYSATNGRFLGSLKNADGTTLSIPGLWAIQFGNGLLSQPTNSLFFAAGPGDEANGLYGAITAVTP